MRVLILSATAGQGHHATAQAISEPLKDKGHTVEILDVFAYISPALKELIANGYLWAIKMVPKSYGSVYNALNKKTTPAKKYSPTALTNQVLAQELGKFIKNFNADAIISVHPFNSMILSQMVHSGVCKALTVGVVTDFTVHPTWEDATALDYYLTAHEQLGFQLSRKGLDPGKMLAYGIPVRPKFYQKRTKQEARKELGLDEDKKTLMIMGGSMGYGRMDQGILSLDALKADFQTIVVCGNNYKMKKRIEKMKLNKTFLLMGYVNNIDQLMDAADCIITKPGGLSVSESLAKGLPMILMNPIPGQETRNAEFLVNNQLAMVANELYPVDEAVDALFSSQYLLENLQKNAHDYEQNRMNSAERLAAFLEEQVASRSAK